MKVTITYEGEPVGRPMYDLDGERLLWFIKAEMELGRVVHIAPDEG